ncbi:MAG: phytoene desaturase [Kiritimatiellales bacterium]|nr:phytoene desaturase [Kiritimatiellota bacterium]MBL7012694.1 phytoene desaturase [Kiritimatiellales bacterium]
MSGKHIAIIGAGPGGLTAAMILAKRGFRVSVFEAQDRVGGRNGAFQLGPYTFDIGPTFLMLKPILDEVFEEAGADCDEVMDMRELKPMYRLQFEEDYIEPTHDIEKMKDEIARVFPGHEEAYATFFEREKKRFDALYPCLQKSYHTWRSFLSPHLIKAVPHLAIGKSLYDIMVKTFGEEKLALSFTFQAKYLGMSPWECPGLFAIIPYIEHAFGIYHPIGGLSRISDTMADTARANGAEIHLSSPVKQILVRDGAACGVELENGEQIESDEVIINADFAYAASTLFAPGVLKKYSPANLEKKKFSCSTFMLYMGLDKQYDLPHHTVFFAKDYRKNVDDIFHLREPDSDLSVYVRNASITDPTLAPEGHSAVYVLVPMPNLRAGIDWKEKKTAFRETVLDIMEARGGMENLREHIVEEKVMTPADWRDELNVYAGATFNLAHSWDQMIHLRPRNKFEEVDNCYLTGGGTHPGSGLPTIYESGRIAANLISRKYGVEFTSTNRLA